MCIVAKKKKKKQANEGNNSTFLHAKKAHVSHMMDELVVLATGWRYRTINISIVYLVIEKKK